MKTANIPHYEAESIEALPDDTVLISISNQHEGPWALKVSGESVFQQSFSDVTGPERSPAGRIYSPMNEDQAYEMAKFIEENKDKDFLVNCHAGISRSGAVCLYIHKTYGHELKPNFWALSHPNPVVVGLLMNAHALHIQEANKSYPQSTKF